MKLFNASKEFYRGAHARRALSPRTVRAGLSVTLVLALLASGCFETEKGEPFYGRVVVPRAQEFRWSDGGLPRVFDPALAAAPPDTDAVRALFEGLTDYDSRTLEPVPAVALRWEASADARQWTFYLRRDARWSNGDPVTAQNFVRSWQRTLRLGDRAPHARLLENIEGAQSAVALVSDPSTLLRAGAETRAEPSPSAQTPTPPAPRADATPTQHLRPAPSQQAKPPAFGAQALGDYVLRVRLRRPDKNFPALVAHPVFRPVHDVDADVDPLLTSKTLEADASAPLPSVVTNGAFRLSGRAPDAVLLERASSYWDASQVELSRVKFIAASDPEAALAAYRRGEVDAVTNAAFEPLALKLLAPYQDFRRSTYGALTYYSFNLNRPPFNDRRVREALAIALDRERLSADTMKGATEPAKKFLPTAAKSDGSEAAAATTDGTPEEREEQEKVAPEEGSSSRQDGATQGSAAGEKSAHEGESAEQEGRASAEGRDAEAGEAEGSSDEAQGATNETVAPLEHDAERARRLLAEAGFPGGAGFPRIRLLVNRNEQQRVMTQAIAAMWRNILGVETEIVMRDWEEYQAALWTGDYDVARRGMVMQTTDEESNMLALFERENRAQSAAAAQASASPSVTPRAATEATPAASGEAADASAPPSVHLSKPILSEAEALRELPAFPVYFASSYALVKPYVVGFETNLLDAPSLKNVRINTLWRPPEEKQIIRVVSNR